MPYKDIDKRRDAGRIAMQKYRETRREEINAAARERRKTDEEWAEKQRAKCRKWLKDNPEHRRAYKKEWNKKNPESVLATKRKSMFGLSRLEQEELLLKQEGRCAICLNEISFLSAHLDHCHETNTIRGFLCPSCNHLLGFAKDSLDILEKAILYLNQSHHPSMAQEIIETLDKVGAKYEETDERCVGGVCGA